MNLENTLKRKVRTIKLMNAELERDELLESEIEDLNELVAELQPMVAEYISNLSTMDLVRRLGPNHWIITCDSLEEVGDSLVLAGIEDLLGVQE